MRPFYANKLGRPDSFESLKNTACDPLIQVNVVALNVLLRVVSGLSPSVVPQQISHYLMAYLDNARNTPDALHSTTDAP
jgi:hypothetical protein